MVATFLAMEGLERQLSGMDRRAISVAAGARSHLQANNPVEFRFQTTTGYTKLTRQDVR